MSDSEFFEPDGEQEDASSESNEVIEVSSSSEEVEQDDPMDVDEENEEEEEEEEDEIEEPSPPPAEEVKRDLFDLLTFCVPDKYQRYIHSTQQDVLRVRELGAQFDARVKEAMVLLSQEDIKL
jgi:hypothetical protein